MIQLIDNARQLGILADGWQQATGDDALAVAEDANEAIFAWAVALAQMKTSRGYMRPEHAFAVAYALGGFYLLLSCADRCDFDAFMACRVHFLGHLTIDHLMEDESEKILLDDLMHRAADIALHGRKPGEELVKRLMTYSLMGLVDVEEASSDGETLLETLDALMAAIRSAGSIPTKNEN